MAASSDNTAGSTVPAGNGGFPPFRTETFPSQIFWLAVTFAVLFVVMWRVAVPRIGGTIGDRKKRIAGDIEAAETHRRNAAKASAEYDAALASARARAHAAAEENRRHIQKEIDDAKAQTEADAAEAMNKAEARIAALRNEAKSHVTNAAREAAVAIVARLTGGTVSAEEAATAVGTAIPR